MKLGVDTNASRITHKDDDSQLALHVILFISRTFRVLHYSRITASEKSNRCDANNAILKVCCHTPTRFVSVYK